MASRAGKAVRTRTKQSARELKSAVESLAEAARTLAKKHGTTRSVTIVKGKTTSRDKPRKI